MRVSLSFLKQGSWPPRTLLAPAGEVAALCLLSTGLVKQLTAGAQVPEHTQTPLLQRARRIQPGNK